MKISFCFYYTIIFVISNCIVCSLEPICGEINCHIPLHKKIGYNYSVYGITKGGLIFIADMMTFSNVNFLNNLITIENKIKHFDCSTATVHLVSNDLSTLNKSKFKKDVNFLIVDASKARIILPSCNWAIYNNILYCEVNWPKAKFVRIRGCYYPKYYYARWSNKLYYLCYNDDSISNKTLFVDEGLNVELKRYGYEDVAPGFVSLNDATIVDYLGQILVLNDAKDLYPNWLLPFQKEKELEPKSERLLSCIVGNKIRYLLQTKLAQFCIHEILTLSFRMTVQLLPNSFNKSVFKKLLEFNESHVFSLFEENYLPVNVLSLIITQQKSVFEEMQISGDVIGTFDMDTFISAALAIPLYIFCIIIISILFIRWRIILIRQSCPLTILISVI